VYGVYPTLYSADSLFISALLQILFYVFCVKISTYVEYVLILHYTSSFIIILSEIIFEVAELCH